jgi:DNA-binding LacI/PurR family transcriptional regulator
MARPHNMAVCRKLEELIRSGRETRSGLLPSERELAARLEVGRGVIRSSLFELERLGRVRLVPSRGWSIVPVRNPERRRLKRILVRVPFLLRSKAWEQQAILAALCRNSSEFFTEAVFSFLDRIADPDELISQVRRGELQGIVFLEEMPGDDVCRRLVSGGIPCVVLNQEKAAGNAVGCGMDFHDIGQRAGRLLTEAGHTRIGAVTGDTDTLIFGEMLRGFRDALGKRRIELAPERLITIPPDEEESCALREMLADSSRPTAIFAMRDCRAAQLFRAARELGLDVPGDLSVISYDDISWPGAKEKALTTFSEDIEGMTSTAMAMLRDWNLTGIRPPSRKLRAELVDRGSVRRLRPSSASVTDER